MADKKSTDETNRSRFEDMKKGGYEPKKDHTNLEKKGYTPKDQGGTQSSELPLGGTGQSLPPVKPSDKT